MYKDKQVREAIFLATYTAYSERRNCCSPLWTISSLEVPYFKAPLNFLFPLTVWVSYQGILLHSSFGISSDISRGLGALKSRNVRTSTRCSVKCKTSQRKARKTPLRSSLTRGGL